MSGPTDKNHQPQSEPTTESPAQQPESEEAAVTSAPRAGDGPTPAEATSETPAPQPDGSDSVTGQVPPFAADAAGTDAAGTDAAGTDAAGTDSPSAAGAMPADKNDFTVTKMRWINPRRRIATWLIAAGAAVVLVGAGFGAGWAAGADGGRHIEMRWDATKALPHGPGYFLQRGDQRNSGRPQLAPRDDDSQGFGPWSRQRGDRQRGEQQGDLRVDPQGTDQQPLPQRGSTPARPGSQQETGSNGNGPEETGSNGNGPEDSGSDSNGSGDDSSTEPVPTMSSSQPSNP